MLRRFIISLYSKYKMKEKKVLRSLFSMTSNAVRNFILETFFFFSHLFLFFFFISKVSFSPGNTSKMNLFADRKNTEKINGFVNKHVFSIQANKSINFSSIVYSNIDSKRFMFSVRIMKRWYQHWNTTNKGNISRSISRVFDMKYESS